MNYDQDSDQTLTVAELGNAELDPGEAAEAIASRGGPSGRTLLWFRETGFQRDTDGLPKQHVEVHAISQALKVVERGPAATYVICVDVAQELDPITGEGEQLSTHLQRIAQSLENGDHATKRLVLLVINGDARPWLKGIRCGKGVFAAAAEGKVASAGDLPKAVESLDAFSDPSWIPVIDGLTPGKIAEIFRNGHHRPALKRMRLAIQTVSGLLRNRGHAVQIMAACALAKVNTVFLGPPGTAKSLLVRLFSKTLGISSENRHISEEQKAMREARFSSGKKGRRMFEYLLTRYTTPEEIFGGVDINLLVSGGIHGRSTVGMLPQAETAFLDEIFKANSAILNTLLSITNERIFYNMGQAFRVNLAFVVGASNETPGDEELGALFDRFPIRVPCMPVSEDDLPALLNDAHRHACGESLQIEKDQKENLRVPQCACLNDLRLLGKIVLGGAYGGTDAFEKGAEFEPWFFQVLKQLRKDFGVSDRTPVNILRLCRALALLDDEPMLKPEHLRAWGYVAPRISQAFDLQKLIAGRIEAFGGRTDALFDGF